MNESRIRIHVGSGHDLSCCRVSFRSSRSEGESLGIQMRPRQVFTSVDCGCNFKILATWQVPVLHLGATEKGQSIVALIAVDPLNPDTPSCAVPHLDPRSYG